MNVMSSSARTDLAWLWHAILTWLRKNLKQALISACIGAGVGYVVNVLLMLFVFDGYTKFDGSGSVVGSLARSTLFLGIGSTVVFSLIGYRRAVGKERFRQDIHNFPAMIGMLFRQDGASARVHLLWGAAISLIAAQFISPWLGAVVAAGLLSAAPSPLGRIISNLVLRAWSGLVGGIAPARSKPVQGAISMTVAILGSCAALAVGFFVTGAVAKLVLALACAATALALAKRSNPQSSFPLLILLSAAAAVLYEVLHPFLALAHDSGYWETNGDLQAMINSGAAGSLLASAVAGATGAGVGGAVGSAIGNVLGPGGGGVPSDTMGPAIQGLRNSYAANQHDLDQAQQNLRELQQQLNSLPPDQRAALLNDPQFKGQVQRYQQQITDGQQSMEGYRQHVNDPSGGIDPHQGQYYRGTARAQVSADAEAAAAEARQRQLQQKFDGLVQFATNQTTGSGRLMGMADDWHGRVVRPDGTIDPAALDGLRAAMGREFTAETNVATGRAESSAASHDLGVAALIAVRDAGLAAAAPVVGGVAAGALGAAATAAGLSGVLGGAAVGGVSGAVAGGLTGYGGAGAYDSSGGIKGAIDGAISGAGSGAIAGTVMGAAGVLAHAAGINPLAAGATMGAAWNAGDTALHGGSFGQVMKSAVVGGAAGFGFAGVGTEAARLGASLVKGAPGSPAPTTAPPEGAQPSMEPPAAPETPVGPRPPGAVDSPGTSPRGTNWGRQSAGPPVPATPPPDLSQPRPFTSNRVGNWGQDPVSPPKAGGGGPATEPRPYLDPPIGRPDLTPPERGMEAAGHGEPPPENPKDVSVGDACPSAGQVRGQLENLRGQPDARAAGNDHLTDLEQHGQISHDEAAAFRNEWNSSFPPEAHEGHDNLSDPSKEDFNRQSRNYRYVDVDTRKPGPDGITQVANLTGVEDSLPSDPNVVRVRVNVQTGAATPLTRTGLGPDVAQQAASRGLDHVENTPPTQAPEPPPRVYEIPSDSPQPPPDLTSPAEPPATGQSGDKPAGVNVGIEFENKLAALQHDPDNPNIKLQHLDEWVRQFSEYEDSTRGDLEKFGGARMPLVDFTTTDYRRGALKTGFVSAAASNKGTKYCTEKLEKLLSKPFDQKDVATQKLLKFYGYADEPGAFIDKSELWVPKDQVEAVRDAVRQKIENQGFGKFTDYANDLKTKDPSLTDAEITDIIVNKIQGKQV